MADLTVWGIIFMITLSEVVIHTQLFIHGNSHGYIPANNEVRYIVDELPLHKEFPSAGAVRISNFEDDVYVSSSHLRLNPRVLDFKDRHLGVPHHKKVIVFNTNGNKTIQLTSISGNTVHFHSSFFEDKVIPPLGNTSFSVVFLGREEGTIESTLFIHTSEGVLKYPVRGTSVSSPYRLRPLVGVHMPINASFAPLIHLHNPHPTPIQIVEIYSSGGELSLELPSGELEATKKLWEILPFETKPVIRARLLAQQALKNHTCYVRIRVNSSSEAGGEHLVIPLEVEVGSTPGLYPPEPSLDLGVLGSEYPPFRLSLRLHNSGRKSTPIQNVFTIPTTKAVKIDFRSIKVPPDSKIATEVAVITFDPRIAFEENHFSGKIVVKGKNRLVIPYHARVLQGGLQFNSSKTSFCTEKLMKEYSGPVNFTVKNTFLSPLVIGNVTLALEATQHFQIHNFIPKILSPGEEILLFQLTPNMTSLSTNFRLESYIQIVTNVSVVTVPLLCYDGHITKVLPPSEKGEDGEALELGLVGVGGSRRVEFAVLNPNPVTVSLESWGLEQRGGGSLSASAELLGVGAGANVADVLAHWAAPPSNLTQTMSLEPHHYAVFRVNVAAGLDEGYSTLEAFVKTAYQRITVPLKIHIAKGTIQLEPDYITFDNCFPGKVSTQPLSVHSTFQQPMRVNSLRIEKQPDPRLAFVKLADVSVRPFTTTLLGELTFDPRLSCGDSCYLGIDISSPAGMQWLQGISLSPGVWEQDVSLLSALYVRFVGGGRSWQNSTLRLDTNEVRGHPLPVSTRLTWPSILSTPPVDQHHRHLNFNLTQVGNTTSVNVELQNPADTYLLLQIALGESYSPGHSVLTLLPVMLHPPFQEAKSASPSEFSISGKSQPDEIQTSLGVLPHRNSLSLMLRPREKYTLKVNFSPVSVNPVSSLIYIRNNLTVLEVLRVSGQGALAQFRFGNRKPGSTTPLQFDLLEKHLKDCSQKEMHKSSKQVMLTVKRSFTARNTGELPIYVSNFLINDLPCEGFGFKVINCKPFLLTANSSLKVEIAFSPDFTLARVQRVLKIITSVGSGDVGVVNYSLVATLPVSSLVPCGQAIPRPTWEALFYYSMLVFMVFLLFCTIAAALIESDRIHKCSMIVAVAAATAALSRANPRGTSLPLVQPVVNQSQQNTCTLKSEPCNKKDLNMSTNLRTEKRSISPQLEERNKQDPSPNPSSNSKISKRKVSKKHSNSGNSDDGPDSSSPSPPSVSQKNRKTVWPGVFVRTERIKNEVKEKQVSSQSTSKGNGRKRLSETTLGSEEDTSSTTTESSNNDDVDKEGIGCKTVRDSYEGDGEEDDDETRGVRTRRSNGKTSKQTKSSLEQPVGVDNSSSSRRQQQAEQKASKLAGKQKSSPKTPASTKPKRSQLERTPLGVVSESETTTWEPPAPSAPDTSELYSKIVAPVPETSPTLVLPELPVTRKKAETTPGPIGPKAVPKRSVQPQRPNWDYVPENRMSYTAGMTAATAEAIANSPSGLLDMFKSGNGLLADTGATPGWDQAPSNSVFKVLQEERRRRVEQHQQRLYMESWPRFEPWEPVPPIYSAPPSQPSVAGQFAVEPAADKLWEGGTASWTSASWQQQDVDPPSPTQQPETPEPILESTPQFNLFDPVTNLWDLSHAGWAHGETRPQP